MHVARAQIVSGSEAAPSSVGTTLSARLSGGQLALSPEVPHPVCNPLLVATRSNFCDARSLRRNTLSSARSTPSPRTFSTAKMQRVRSSASLDEIQMWAAKMAREDTGSSGSSGPPSDCSDGPAEAPRMRRAVSTGGFGSVHRPAQPSARCGICAQPGAHICPAILVSRTALADIARPN